MTETGAHTPRPGPSSLAFRLHLFLYPPLTFGSSFNLLNSPYFIFSRHRSLQMLYSPCEMLCTSFFPSPHVALHPAGYCLFQVLVQVSLPLESLPVPLPAHNSSIFFNHELMSAQRMLSLHSTSHKFLGVII